MPNKINTGEILKAGKDIVIKNFSYFLGLMGIIIAVQIAFSIIMEIGKNNSGFTFLINVLSYCASLLISIGIIKACLGLIDGKKESLSKFLSNYKLIGKYFVSSLLYGIMLILPIAIPLVLFFGLYFVGNQKNTLGIIFGILGIIGIIAAVILSLKFMFYQYFIVDKNSEIIESLKLSSIATKGERWQIFVLVLVLSLINIAGALALLIGLLFTIPLSMTCMAIAFRKLTGANINPAPIAPLPAQPPVQTN